MPMLPPNMPPLVCVRINVDARDDFDFDRQEIMAIQRTSFSDSDM